MADYNPTTVYNLIQIGHTLAFDGTITKQLARFGIALAWNDPQLSTKLSSADPALVNYLATRLVQAIYDAP